MIDTIVIRRGPDLAKTRATVEYDRNGQSVGVPTVICDDWYEGALKAQGLTLFVDSGTLFDDIQEFFKVMQAYPHKGLIGHIIDPLNTTEYFYLHWQCFLIDLNQLSPELLKNSSKTLAVPIRSEKNIHNDYTPLWLKPTGTVADYESDRFGQQLISAQLDRGQPVVNWHQVVRGMKHYIYDPSIWDSWIVKQQWFKDMTENQLWILNNEEVRMIGGSQFVGPASGLCWVLNLCRPEVTGASLIDVSKNQVEFANALLDWDGQDYGTFAYNFMKRNVVRYFRLDQEFTQEQVVDMLKTKKFIEYVNQHVDMLCRKFDINISEAWPHAKSKTVTVTHGDLIQQVLNTEVVPSNVSVWASNVTTFKYNLLNHTQEDLERFEEIVGKHP